MNVVRHLSLLVGSAALLWLAPAPAQVYQPSGKPLDAAAADDEVPDSRFMLYSDKIETDFIPGGYMPDGSGIKQDAACKDDPHGGKYCIRAGYRLADNSYVGLGWLWQNKHSDHTRQPPDLLKKLNAQKGDTVVLRFWARSKDRAWIKPVAGGGSGDSIAFPVNTEPLWIELTPQWRRYEIDLSKQDLSRVIMIFSCWLDRDHNEELKLPVVQWDLDDVYLVKLKK